MGNLGEFVRSGVQKLIILVLSLKIKAEIESSSPRVYCSKTTHAHVVHSGFIFVHLLFFFLLYVHVNECAADINQTRDLVLSSRAQCYRNARAIRTTSIARKFLV